MEFQAPREVFGCPLCNLVFLDSNYLTHHITVDHSNWKLYKVVQSNDETSEPQDCEILEEVDDTLRNDSDLADTEVGEHYGRSKKATVNTFWEGSRNYVIKPRPPVCDDIVYISDSENEMDNRVIGSSSEDEEVHIETLNDSHPFNLKIREESFKTATIRKDSLLSNKNIIEGPSAYEKFNSEPITEYDGLKSMSGSFQATNRLSRDSMDFLDADENQKLSSTVTSLKQLSALDIYCKGNFHDSCKPRQTRSIQKKMQKDRNQKIIIASVPCNGDWLTQATSDEERDPFLLNKNMSEFKEMEITSINRKYGESVSKQEKIDGFTENGAFQCDTDREILDSDNSNTHNLSNTSKEKLRKEIYNQKATDIISVDRREPYINNQSKGISPCSDSTLVKFNTQMFEKSLNSEDVHGRSGDICIVRKSAFSYESNDKASNIHRHTEKLKACDDHKEIDIWNEKRESVLQNESQESSLEVSKDSDADKRDLLAVALVTEEEDAIDQIRIVDVYALDSWDDCLENSSNSSIHEEMVNSSTRLASTDLSSTKLQVYHSGVTDMVHEGINAIHQPETVCQSSSEKIVNKFSSKRMNTSVFPGNSKITRCTNRDKCQCNNCMGKQAGSRTVGHLKVEKFCLKPFKCSRCLFACSKKESLVFHVRRCFRKRRLKGRKEPSRHRLCGQIKDKVVCFICHKKIENKFQLVQHLYRLHADIVNSESVKSEILSILDIVEYNSPDMAVRESQDNCGLVVDKAQGEEKLDETTDKLTNIFQYPENGKENISKRAQAETFEGKKWHIRNRNPYLQIKKIGSFSCSLCDFKFKSLYDLSIHRLGEHLGELDSRNLSGVPKNIETLDGIYRNLRQRNEVSDVHSVNDSLSKVKGKFSCSKCFKTFKFKEDLRRHSIIHKVKNHKCSFCGKWYTKMYLKFHILRCINKIYRQKGIESGICETESEAKKSSSKWDQDVKKSNHVRNSTETQLLNDSGDNLVNQTVLKQSLRGLKPEDNPGNTTTSYKCCWCDREFRSYYHLHSHKVAIHCNNRVQKRSSLRHGKKRRIFFKKLSFGYIGNNRKMLSLNSDHKIRKLPNSLTNETSRTNGKCSNNWKSETTLTRKKVYDGLRNGRFIKTSLRRTKLSNSLKDANQDEKIQCICCERDFQSRDIFKLHHADCSRGGKIERKGYTNFRTRSLRSFKAASDKPGVSQGQSPYIDHVLDINEDHLEGKDNVDCEDEEFDFIGFTKPFICLYCGVGFSDKFCYQLHQSKHHNKKCHSLFKGEFELRVQIERLDTFKFDTKIFGVGLSYLQDKSIEIDSNECSVCKQWQQNCGCSKLAEDGSVDHYHLMSTEDGKNEETISISITQSKLEEDQGIKGVQESGISVKKFFRSSDTESSRSNRRNFYVKKYLQKQYHHNSLNKKFKMQARLRNSRFSQTMAQCSVCKKSFASRIQLKQHEISHVSSKHNGNMKQNVYAHNNHFSESDTYNPKLSGELHLTAVNGKFWCDKCDRSFIREKGLKQHLNTHSSFNRYQCLICGFRGKYKSTINSHFKIYHPHTEIVGGTSYCILKAS